MYYEQSKYTVYSTSVCLYNHLGAMPGQNLHIFRRPLEAESIQVLISKNKHVYKQFCYFIVNFLLNDVQGEFFSKGLKSCNCSEWQAGECMFGLCRLWWGQVWTRWRRRSGQLWASQLFLWNLTVTALRLRPCLFKACVYFLKVSTDTESVVKLKPHISDRPVLNVTSNYDPFTWPSPWPLIHNIGQCWYNNNNHWTLETNLATESELQQIWMCMQHIQQHSTCTWRGQNAQTVLYESKRDRKT